MIRGKQKRDRAHRYGSYDFGFWDTLTCDYHFWEQCFVNKCGFWLDFKNKHFTLIFWDVTNF